MKYPKGIYSLVNNKRFAFMFGLFIYKASVTFRY